MNCDETQARLADFFDQALDAATTKDVEDHLASCPRCGAEAEQLAGCLRQVASLETVDPPLGFSERVMARVREIESKPSLWQRLLFPLSIKLPIHATAVVLISIMALYLLKKVPPGEEAKVTTAPSFSALEKKKEAGLGGERQAFDALARRNENAGGTASIKAQVQTSESQPKGAPKTAEVRADEEKSSSFQDRQIVESKPTGVLPSIAAREKSKVRPDEASSGGAKSLAEKPGLSSAPAAPELEGRAATAESGAVVPTSPEAVSGSRTPSVPPESAVRQLQTTSDVELVVRRAPSSNVQRRDNLGALDKSVKRESLPAQEADERVAPLLPAIPESVKPQEVWLTITRAQYDQLKRELLAVGPIESESWLSSREKEGAFRADDRLRIKVTVLPPPALPPER